MLITLFIYKNGKASVSVSEDSTRIMNICRFVKENVSDYKLGMQYINEADKIAVVSSCESCKAEVLFTLAYLYSRHEKIDTAIYHYKQALDIYKFNHNYAKAIETIEYAAYILMEEYRYREAIDFVSSELEFADYQEYGDLKANLYLLLGASYDGLGLYEKSVENLVEALNLFEAKHDSIGMNSCLINLGSVFLFEENYSDAYEYMNRAMEISLLLDDKSSISICLNNIGYVYSYTNRYEEALDYFSKSLELDQEMGYTNGISICLNNIGDTYKDLGDTVMAISYYMKSLDVARSDSGAIIATLLTNISEVRLSQRKLKEALNLAQEGLFVAEKTGNIEDILTSFELLHKIYSEMGKYELAYHYLAESVKLNDSTYSVSKSNFIQEVKAKYNDERQRTEISSLKRKNVGESEIRRYLIITILAISILIISMFFVNILIRRSRKHFLKQKIYYEKLLEYSEDYVTVIDTAGITLYISPSYERRIGREVSNRVGKSVFDYIHPDDTENVKKEFKGLVVDSRPRSISFRIITAFDKTITVYAFGQNLINHPVIKGIVVNFWDITQLKNNEETIRHSEVKFREIFNAFPDIYFQTDTKGVITEISPSIKKLIGYDREELIGISPYEYYHFIEDWKKIAARFETKKKVNDHDTKVKTKSGEVIHCSFSGEFIYDSNNSRIGLKGVIRNISGRIKNQRKLEDSQLKLREANSAKEKIFSIIAHDLIGPIGTNKSIVDLIVNQVDELTHDEIVTLIASLKPSLDATYSLIENLLSWARIQQNRIVPNFENIHLLKMLHIIVDVLTSQAHRKSVTFEVDGDEELQVFGDQNQLDIVFRNLMSNAIKFSNRGGKVDIVVSEVQDMVDVRIIDTGVGMKKRQINKVLAGKGVDEITRGTDNEKGTGFGLAIVNEFVSNNKGNINIISEENKGTTFIVALPKGK